VTGILTPAARRLRERHLALAAGMLEKELLANIRELVKTEGGQRKGWLIYHTHDSQRSERGWPDLAVKRPDGCVLFRELKKQDGRVTAEQEAWLKALAGEGLDVGVWRPIDWLDRTIHHELGIVVTL
jgi:VRR-NUC domain